MTSTPIADSIGQHAAPQQAGVTPVSQLTRWGRIHADITGFGHALLRMAPVFERIADPQVEQAVEVIMAMAGLGAEAHEFQAIIDLGEAVISRRTGIPLTAPGTAERPSFQPAPDAPQDGM